MDEQSPHAKFGRKPWPFGTAIPQRFSGSYRRYQQLGGQVDIAEDGKAYAGEGALIDVERLMMFSLVFDQIVKEDIQGDFLELGVYKGDTAALLAQYAQRFNQKLWLLDTYEGFDDRDFVGIDAGRRSGVFGDTSLAAVKHRIGPDNAEFIKGYFPETAECLPPDARYALVHIDVDLYAPIWNALTYFYPRMVPGGYLIVHDYTSLGWAGADRAVDDFFADKPECVIAMPDSAGSAVVRRQRAGGSASNWILKQQVLQANSWQSFGHGRATYMLQEGWASAEDWGVWGVGNRHTLLFLPSTSHGNSVTFECDVHAYIPPGSNGRSFDVLLNGAFVLNWMLTKENNRGIRQIDVTSVAGGMLTVTFVPKSVSVPSADDPASKDTRPLGLALHRVRVLG
jgi:hypothetical protein